MNIPARCPRCRRILFPTNNNTLPLHLVPPPVRRVVNTDSYGSARLTGPGDPRCGGSGERARKRNKDDVVGEAFRKNELRRARRLRRERSLHNGSR